MAWFRGLLSNRIVIVWTRVDMIYKCLKLLYLVLYNKKYHTKIKSYRASLSAKYGYSVLIDKGTIVEPDVSIGDYSYVNKNSSLENCVVGKFCSISSGCMYAHMNIIRIL